MVLVLGGRRRQAHRRAGARARRRKQAGAADRGCVPGPRLRHGNHAARRARRAAVVWRLAGADASRRHVADGAPQARRRPDRLGARHGRPAAAVRARVRRVRRVLRRPQSPARRRRAGAGVRGDRGGAAPRRPAGLRRHQPARLPALVARDQQLPRPPLADAHHHRLRRGDRHRDRGHRHRPGRQPPSPTPMAERCFSERQIADALAAAGLEIEAREAWAPFADEVAGKTWWIVRRPEGSTRQPKSTDSASAETASSASSRRNRHSLEDFTEETLDGWGKSAVGLSPFIHRK